MRRDREAAHQHLHVAAIDIFDEFPDGKVKLGWGVYATEKYSTAVHHAFNKHRPEKNKNFYVYTVEIPDRTEDNCLSLLKGVPVAEAIVKRPNPNNIASISEKALSS